MISTALSMYSVMLLDVMPPLASTSTWGYFAYGFRLELDTLEVRVRVVGSVQHLHHSVNTYTWFVISSTTSSTGRGRGWYWMNYTLISKATVLSSVGKKLSNMVVVLVAIEFYCKSKHISAVPVMSKSTIFQQWWRKPNCLSITNYYLPSITISAPESAASNASLRQQTSTSTFEYYTQFGFQNIKNKINGW